LQVQREWYAQRQISALVLLAEAHAARAEPLQALHYARRALELDPWHEPMHRRIMRLLAAQGERNAALAQYERCRRVLADELGVEPEAATRALADQIRAGAATAVAPPTTEAPAGPPPASPISAPPALTLAPLPVPPTRLIGRAAEVRDLEALLTRPACRLLTLLGPGGVGKTRLALRLAELLAHRYADGVLWLTLDGLVAVEAFTALLARALGCAVDDTGDALAQVRTALAPRRLLLALDNFEALMSAAAVVRELLSAAPHLTILITSRERLQLQSEWVYDVDGLALPGDPAEPWNADALVFFADRLQQAGYRLDPIADLAAAVRIARLVEGNPLALELAASACRAQRPADVAAAIEADLDVLRVRLRDVPERHRSMRAAIAYSWNLLTGGERLMLAFLSVLRNGFSDDAAVAVAHASPDDLVALADKSLLRRAGSRNTLHELVRRFAAEQLAITGQAPVARVAQLDWCVAYAEAAEPHLTGAAQQEWLEQLEVEHANLRAALAYAIEHAHTDAALRLVAALVRFWWMHGHVREGRGWIEQALALEGGSIPARARALHAGGSLAGQMGDLAVAVRLLEQSLALERTVGRPAELVRVLNNLAFLYLNHAEYAAAETLLAEALALDQARGDAHGVAFDYGGLAQIAFFRSDYVRASELWLTSLAGHRRAGDRHSVAVTLLNLGSVRRFQGDLTAARSALEESLAAFRTLGSAYGLAHTHVQLAHLAYAVGDRPAAQAQLAAGLPLFADQGVSGELAGALSLCARIALDDGQVRRSARLWSAALMLLDDRGASLQPPDMLEFGRTLAAARAQAAGREWDAGWAEGRTLALEVVIAAALAGNPAAEL
jgi:predicted ATPase